MKTDKKGSLATKREAVVTFLKDPMVSFVSLVKYGANNTPFRVVKSNKGGSLMGKVIQAIMVPKDSAVDVKKLMGADIRDDVVTEEGSYKMYEQVEKSAVDLASKSLVVVDPNEHVYAVTYDLLVDKKTIQILQKDVSKIGTSTADWDAEKAKSQFQEYAKKENEETDISKYREGFVLLDGDSNDLASYKMPTRYIEEGKVVSVWKGLTAAMGELHGGGGFSDEEAKQIYDYLAQEFALFDAKPPDFASLVAGTIEKSAVVEQEKDSVVATRDVKEVGFYDLWEELLAVGDLISGVMSQSLASQDERKGIVLKAIDNFRAFCEAVFSQAKTGETFTPARKIGEVAVGDLTVLNKQVSELLKNQVKGGKAMFDFETKEELGTFISGIVVQTLEKKEKDAATVQAAKDIEAANQAKDADFKTLKETVEKVVESVEKISGTVITPKSGDDDPVLKKDQKPGRYEGMFSKLQTSPGTISQLQ